MACTSAKSPLSCLADMKMDLHMSWQSAEALHSMPVQERPEDVPTGELPRNILMAVDRSMVGTIAPGTRITAVAIYSTVQVRARRLRCP